MFESVCPTTACPRPSCLSTISALARITFPDWVARDCLSQVTKSGRFISYIGRKTLSICFALKKIFLKKMTFKKFSCRCKKMLIRLYQILLPMFTSNQMTDHFCQGCLLTTQQTHVPGLISGVTVWVSIGNFLYIVQT